MYMPWASSPTSHLALPTLEGTPPAARNLPPAHLPDPGSLEYLQGEVELFTVHNVNRAPVYCPLTA